MRPRCRRSKIVLLTPSTPTIHKRPPLTFDRLATIAGRVPDAPLIAITRLLARGWQKASTRS